MPKLPAVTLTRREQFLVLLFLRPYVTWCAHTKHVSRAQQAARLWRSIRERGPPGAIRPSKSFGP